MTQRPRDILEFLRRASHEEGAPPPEGIPGEVAPPPPAAPHVNVTKSDKPLVVFRRSQVVVAGVAAVLLPVLTFLLGLAMSGPEQEASQPENGLLNEVWTIRVITYDDTRNGLLNARTVASQLAQIAEAEAALKRLDRQGKLVVCLGSWLRNPRENREAVELLGRIRRLEDRNGKKNFEGADFYRLTR